jgi:hypothetical protein
MNVKNPESRRPLGSDLARVDAHVIQADEYEEIPELTEESLANAIIKRRERSASGASGDSLSSTKGPSRDKPE